MITITFTPETPAQADIIAKLMGAYLNAADAAPAADPETAAVEAPKAEAPKKSRSKAAPTAEAATTGEPTAPTTAAPASTTSASEATEGNGTTAATPAPEAGPTASTASSQDSTVTLEQVRAKLSALSQAGKAAQVKGLIAQFGVMKLTDVPAEKFGKLLEEATALEAA